MNVIVYICDIFSIIVISLIAFMDGIRVGIKLPTVEVRFEHLNVDAVAYVGSRASTTFFSYYTNMVEVIILKFEFCFLLLIIFNITR